MSDIESPTKSFQQNVEKAFAPVVDAVKSVTEKLEVPEAARDFVKRSVEVAQERAASVHTGSVKATDAIESAAAKAVADFARVSRDVQAAAYDDAKAYLASITKIAGAKSLSEAVQIQVDYLRERADVNVSRTKSVVEFVTGSFAEGAKKAQENFSKAQENLSKIATFNKAA